MIPKKIHQTWRTHTYTRNDGSPESWKALNPNWDYKLWTDADLETFVRGEFPDFWPLYQSYPQPVQRADLARYMLLYRFGGIYADMDTDCLASLDAIVGEDRVVLCQEPPRNAAFARELGIEHFMFNGTMASPAGHPFWQHVLEVVWKCRHSADKDVLGSTGPLVLSGAAQNWPDQDDICRNSCHLFAPIDNKGRVENGPPWGDYAALRLSRHNWAGTWFAERQDTLFHWIKGRVRKARARIMRPKILTTEAAAHGIDKQQLCAPVPPASPDNLPNVAIFVPVRDGAPYLERHFELVAALDYPKDRLRIAYCEGGSRDATLSMLEQWRQDNPAGLQSVDILSEPASTPLARKKRWKPGFQRKRRAAIAAARNRLAKEALRADDDWVLWLDADLSDFPADIIQTMMAPKVKIITPNSVLEADGRSYDLNAFLDVGTPRKSQYYKHIIDGLFQPPADYWHRRHLHDLKFVDLVPLSSVGGTMLLVHGSVHRAGLDFPERPYNDLIETEAFGSLANDLGLTPFGLPNVEIRHVAS